MIGDGETCANEGQPARCARQPERTVGEHPKHPHARFHFIPPNPIIPIISCMRMQLSKKNSTFHKPHDISIVSDYKKFRTN